MNSHLYHLQLNIDMKNVDFYQKLMPFLGWEVIFQDHETLGFRSGEVGDLWFYDGGRREKQDYDAIGLNHVAVRVSEEVDIDKLTTFLQSLDTKTLFETPRHRPEFVTDEAETYYQVMFESPDKILFEVVYFGPKG